VRAPFLRQTLWLNPNKDEKSGSAGIEVVASVVGVGVGVDGCGRGVNEGIGGGMVDAAFDEVLGITITSMVMRRGV
ncbi:hypothetical protein Tco_0197015, partial [Tanacetum coccineum]